uniref:Uncharacterized protein n=1 Tax=Poecilia reticulata TaxID=8081 RepID=A0A3P9N6M6_POERE
ICSSMNQSMCRINYVIGDLFTASNHESLAHCVSRDLRMGKGIVVLFKNKFGRTSELKGQSELLERSHSHIFKLDFLLDLKSI